VNCRVIHYTRTIIHSTYEHVHRDGLFPVRSEVTSGECIMLVVRYPVYSQLVRARAIVTSCSLFSLGYPANYKQSAACTDM
jgi:hypothetical protein